MDDADFSEDTTFEQQEDLPYDGDLSQTKMCTSYNSVSTNDTFLVSVEAVLAGGDPQETAALHEMCQNMALVAPWDKMNESSVNSGCYKDKQCTWASPAPANKGDTAKSHISDIFLHHLSREPFLKDEGVGHKTAPETSNIDSLDDIAIFTNIVSHYARKYCPQKQTPEFTDQPSSQSGAKNSNKPSCSPGTIGENTSPLEKPVIAGQSGHQEDASLLSRLGGLGDKHNNSLGQTPQRQLTDKASSGNPFKHGQSQVHCQLPDFPRVAPKVKIPRNTVTNKPFTIANQASFSPRLRNKSTVVQDNLGTMSGSNCVEKQPDQKWKFTEPSQQTQVEPATHTRQEPLTGIESEKCHLKLTPTPQKDPSSNSYIFQKLSQGKQMCQKLKEQTDQLKAKVQEFSKRIKQDSLCRLQDIRLMTKEHTGCCLLGPRGSRGTEVTGLPRAGSQEATFKELMELVPKMKQKIEKRDHRRTNCRRFSGTIHEKTLCQDSPLGSDPGPSFCSDSGTGLQSNKCEGCGSKTYSSQRVCSKEPPKEFYYRYDTPGQDGFSHGGGYTFAQSHFLHGNKMSLSSCSKPKRICSQRVNLEPFQDEHSSVAGKHPKIYLTCTSDSVTPSPHLHFLWIPGIQSLCDGHSMEEMESKILNSALDHALKTATILKKTTDQMIKSIAEDLTKVQQWKQQLKYY
ncbi:protein AKNAD1 [Acomys russatus]|uniref:protein AKNAD1 n=1 Tax=Acomys russatus TaxID=60746 RepID=UPI0021E1CC78|nr:protein AKNAD1 [Acomys russatus]